MQFVAVRNICPRGDHGRLIKTVFRDQIIPTSRHHIVQWDWIKLLTSPNQISKSVQLVFLIEDFLGYDSRFPLEHHFLPGQALLMLLAGITLTLFVLLYSAASRS